MVPGNHLRKIEINPEGKRTYELANGTEIAMDVTVVRIEFIDEFVGATVIFGNDDV